MSVHRFAARRDTVESGLIALAERLGALIVQAGPFDLWCCHRGIWRPVEIKSPRGQYTQAQKRFLYRCQLAGAPAWLWRCEEDVLKCLGALDSA